MKTFIIISFLLMAGTAWGGETESVNYDIKYLKANLTIDEVYTQGMQDAVDCYGEAIHLLEQISPSKKYRKAHAASWKLPNFTGCLAEKKAKQLNQYKDPYESLPSDGNK